MCDSVDRVEKLLAILLLRQQSGASDLSKATQLSIAGFTNTEIADLMEMTAAHVCRLLIPSKRRRKEKP